MTSMGTVNKAKKTFSLHFKWDSGRNKLSCKACIVYVISDSH